MKYLCLVYLDAERWAACSDPECADYVQQLAAGRRLLAAEPLHPTHTATTVRVRIPPARYGSVEVRPVRELQTQAVR